MTKRSNKARNGSKPKNMSSAPRALARKKMAIQRLPRDNDERRMYKNLLLDPCNASLPRSPYDLTSAPAVSRAMQMFTNTQVFGIFFYHPVLGQFSYESATDVAGSVTPFGFGLGPSRALAGCHTVSFIAQESSRAGTISCGVVPGSVVWRYLSAANGGQGNTLKPSEAAAHLSNIERTPVDRCEVNWFPSEGDSEMLPLVQVFTAANTNLIQATLAKVNFTMVVGLSLSAGGAYQHKYVAVVEQEDPQVSSVSPWNVTPASKPSFNWREVVESLSATDPAWYVNTFRKIGTFVSGGVSAYATMGLPGALGYLTQAVAGMGRSKQFIRPN